MSLGSLVELFRRVPCLAQVSFGELFWFRMYGSDSGFKSVVDLSYRILQFRASAYTFQLAQEVGRPFLQHLAGLPMVW